MFSRRALCWRYIHGASRREVSSAVFPQVVLSSATAQNLVNPPTLDAKVATSRDAFEKAKEMALAGGGEKGNHVHVKRNKKVLPRERVSRILDDGAPFLELSLQAGQGMDYGDVPNAGVITGIGAVHDQLCMIIANDATVKGGTVFPITLKKQLRAQEIALENCLPCIYVIDSGGAFLPLQSEIFNPGGRAFYNQAVMSSRGIPQLAFVCGSCTAGGAYIPTMADESVIVRGIGHVFLGGPPLVKAALGEDVTAEELGGADLHCQVSGCTDHLANSEEEAFSILRSIVASLNLPSSHPPPRPPIPPLHPSTSLISHSTVDFSFLVACLVDDGRIHEFKGDYGDHLRTRCGFAHLDGRLVGVLAILGPITIQDAIKACHFLQLTSQRDVPLIIFQNCQGNDEETPTSSPTSSYEVTSLLRAHAQLMTAIANAGSPIVTVAVGPNDHLSAFAAAPPSFSPRFSFAWPHADAPVPGMSDPESILQLALSGHPDMAEDKKAKLLTRFQREQMALHAASRCWIDGVILPEDTRDVLSSCLRIFERAKENRKLFEKRENMTLTSLKF